MPNLSYNQFVLGLKKTENALIKELGKILLTGALRMEKIAKTNATVDPKVRTGRLRASIRGFVIMNQGEPRLVLRAGGANSGVADVFYAEIVEKGLGRLKYPRYFLKKAIEREASRLQDDLETALKRASNA